MNFSHAIGEPAAKVANTLAEFYLTWQQSEKLKQTKEASAWLSAQIKELTRKVEAADIAAERFRSTPGLFEGTNNTTLHTQQLSELNSQIILAKAQRTEADARAVLMRKMLKEKGDVDGAADILNSRLIQRVLEQRVRVQRETAEVSINLLPSHPRIKGLRPEIADLQRQIPARGPQCCHQPPKQSPDCRRPRGITPQKSDPVETDGCKGKRKPDQTARAGAGSPGRQRTA